MNRKINSISKRTLSIILAVLMIFALLPITALQAFAGSEGEALESPESDPTIIGGGASVTS
jgi:hypothetical protein